MRKLSLVVSLLFFGASAPAFAATFQSATLFASIESISDSTSVPSIPDVAPITISNADGSSTVSPDFTGIVFKTSFAQTINAGTLGADGKSDVTFQAAAGDTYTLFGSTEPVTGVGNLEVSLVDDTTQQTLYDALTGSTTIGSDTGSLTGGNVYEFLLNDKLTVQQFASAANAIASPLATNTGSGGITILPGIVTPEPATVGMIMLLVGGVMPVAARRRRQSTQP